ncbi:3-deoxy-D-manno-octulosonic acid transferase [Tamlana haliotis]|uniref:3-deoxy-D-manno-octulosonic acid transferase n=1 Tax=Pseudotamlana haliotis TaxID=2614804 RepID=A0A6N6MG68_9FLAO|nr:glycosyltransferase N-terminal domain-containing protein [Tamlana haliotis]KAB1068382.1 3-deoxy-D-manno-octulosonic acid transferase [Tamlana haliotis]
MIVGLIYNIGIQLTDAALHGGALMNDKLRKGVEGRKNTFNILEKQIKPSDKTLWFHCASLGEYEQGLPVFKALRTHYKTHKIVLSFFSPSGYEIRKNTAIADVVVYLPLDTKNNAKRFLDIVNPELTIFVKYDIWPVFLKELKKRKQRAILISAAFRENQSFFKWYGKPLREALFAFEHIFTQNESSKALLNSINYDKVTVSGDTRYDRVTSQLDIDNTLDFIAEFKDQKLCIIAGSTWSEGESMLINFINEQADKDLKFIIAPHQMKAEKIEQLQRQLQVPTVLFSEMENHKLSEAKVFIVNTIGLLTKIYSYADIAYVGGALGSTGLHNTLEPAVFGIPIIIGNHFDKFPEAKALIDHGGMFSISNQKAFNEILGKLISNKDIRLEAGHKNEAFIKKNTGAVVQVLNYLRIL